MTHQPDQRRHDDVRELIPWWVNGRLSQEDAAEVRAHLEACRECRADVAIEERIRGMVRQSPRVEYAPQASFQKLLGRIDHLQPGVVSSTAGTACGAVRSERERRAPRWRLAAAIVVPVGLSLLAAALWSTPPRIYRTATTAGDISTGTVQVRVVFAPDMTIDDLTRLAREAGLSIVSGPSESGVYGLAIEQNQRTTPTELAARLRQDPRVRFAEPVADTAAPR